MDSDDDRGQDILRLEMKKEGGVKEVLVMDGQTVLDVLKRMGIMPDGILVFSGSRPVPLDEPVSGLGTLEVVTVASGG